MIHKLELELAQAGKRATDAEAAAERAFEEKAAAEALSASSHAGFEAAVREAAQAISRGGGGGGGGVGGAEGEAGGEEGSSSNPLVAAIEAVNAKWQGELGALQEEHKEQCATMQGRFNKQVDAYKQAAARANDEWGAAENDLTQDRQSLLEVGQASLL